MDCGEMRFTAWVFTLEKALCSGCAAAELERFHSERFNRNEADKEIRYGTEKEYSCSIKNK